MNPWTRSLGTSGILGSTTRPEASTHAAATGVNSAVMMDPLLSLSTAGQQNASRSAFAWGASPPSSRLPSIVPPLHGGSSLLGAGGAVGAVGAGVVGSGNVGAIRPPLAASAIPAAAAVAAPPVLTVHSHSFSSILTLIAMDRDPHIHPFMLKLSGFIRIHRG